MIKKRRSRAFALIELAIVILIIGVVIAAVLTADHLISKARISAAQSLTRNAPLTSMSDMIFWLESSMPTSFESSEADNGKSLSTWKDNSNLNNKNNAITGSSSPTYANTINRIHAAKFINGQHFVINGSALNDSDYTILIVEKRLSNSADNYFVGDPAATDLNQTLLLGYSTNGKIMHSQGADNSYTSNVDSYEESLGKARIIIFTSSSSGKKTYINGVLAASSTNTSRLSNISNLVIGKAYNGEIGEIAAFSHAFTDPEREEVETYLSKKYEVKKFSGSCINGTIKVGTGCAYTTCSVSVNGSSATSVNSGSGAITCDQTGFSGSVSYDCSMGVANVTGTCACASGYTSSGGSCIRNCSVNVIGSSTTTTTSGGASISCNQTGYSGTVNNTCAADGATVTGTCACAVGYALSGGVCAGITCTASAGTGYNTQSGLAYAASGSGSFACDATGYTGTKNYICTTNGAATITGGTCACASGYTSSGGSCVKNCAVSVAGSSTTTTYVGGSAIACNQTGYSGNVNNTCSSSGTTVTGTCACATGYSLSGGVCVSACANPRWTLVADASSKLYLVADYSYNIESGAITCSFSNRGKFSTLYTYINGATIHSGTGVFSCYSVCNNSWICPPVSCPIVGNVERWAATLALYRCDC